ncbi:MAG TPA: amino acid permease [Gemmatimonadaceae bacterium]|nr:amino acid permease [Gemmatimonadaceae bacterium]
MTNSPPQETEAGSLARGLSLIAATAIVVGGIIGTGVFLKARVMTCNVGTPGLVMLAWVGAGMLSLAGALTYAELAAMMPRAGGEYVFMREAYGPRWAVVYGWTQVSITYTASQAAKGIALAIFLNALLGGALSGTFFTATIAGRAIPFGGVQIVALTAIAVIALINCAAVAVNGAISIVLTLLKAALIVGIGVGAFLFADGNWTQFATSGAAGACTGVSAATRGGFAGFGAAMLGALWAYDGWSNMTQIAGEVRNPQRNVPLGLIAGMIVVIVLYLLVNAAYFYVLPPSDIASIAPTSSVATEVTRRFLGAIAVSFIAATMMTSTLGSLHTGVLAGARIPYAMSRDGLFFKRLGIATPRTHVPANAVIALAIWAGILVLSGSFDELTDSVIFASYLFYGLVTASVFLFRRTRPDAERPYRTWGYPVIPAIFLGVTAWLLITTLITSPRQSLIGLVIVSLGFPIYSYFGRPAGTRHR